MNTGQEKIEMKLIDGSFATIKDNDKFKALKSEKYNFFFDKKTGFFVRWGKGKITSTKEKASKQELELYFLWSKIWREKLDIQQFLADLETDGDVSVGVPEILDFEISTKCAGVSMSGGKASPCAFCYKSNNNTGSYMSTEDFTNVLDKMPPSLTQVALGIGNIDQPNLWEIMDVIRDRGVIPNITINGDRMTDEYFDNLSEKCGAVAVSYYDKDLTFNAVQELATKRKMNQVNIHFFLSEETFDKGMKLIEDAENDERMKDLNAIVFLSAKLRGNAEKNDYHILSQEKYNIISQRALNSSINVGMDSCSAFKTLESYKNEPNFKMIEQSVEPCESSIYSTYINSDGLYFPCSFSENIEFAPGDWTEGIDVLECNDFMEDVWFAEKTRTFANEVERCRSCGKSCAIFEI